MSCGLGLTQPLNAGVPLPAVAANNVFAAESPAIPIPQTTGAAPSITAHPYALANAHCSDFAHAPLTTPFGAPQFGSLASTQLTSQYASAPLETGLAHHSYGGYGLGHGLGLGLGHGFGHGLF